MLIDYTPLEIFKVAGEVPKTYCTECKKEVFPPADYYALIPNVTLKSGRVGDLYLPFCKDCVENAG